MIRVNLLPVKAAKRREYGRQQLLLFATLVVFELVGLYLIYASREEALDEAAQKNAHIQSEIGKLGKDARDFEALKRRREQLKQKQNVLDELDRMRYGPVRVMDELRFLLYQPTKITDAKSLEDQKGWDIKWDSKYLWLESYTELAGEVTIEGYARTNDDVAEFFKRMTTSPYFMDVDLTKSQVTSGRRWENVTLVHFIIQCKVRYRLSG